MKKKSKRQKKNTDGLHDCPLLICEGPVSEAVSRWQEVLAEIDTRRGDAAYRALKPFIGKPINAALNKKIEAALRPVFNSWFKTTWESIEIHLLA